MNQSETNTLVYLYGISPKSSSVQLSNFTGVDATSPVDQIEAGEFTCWISRVSTDEFGEALQRNMENLDWLATVSVRHQRVVGAIYAKIQILPARFATLFSSSDALVRDVVARKRELWSALQRLEGADEWAVRVFSVPGKSPQTVAAASSGRDYLEQKSQLLKTNVRHAISQELKNFVSELNGLSREITQGGKLGAGQPHLEWYASLLVPRPKKKKMDTLIERFLEQHGARYRIECTGPWPPYSFMKPAHESSQP